MKKSITALWVAVSLLTRSGEESREKRVFLSQSKSSKKKGALYFWTLTLLFLFFPSSLSPLDGLLGG